MQGYWEGSLHLKSTRMQSTVRGQWPDKQADRNTCNENTCKNYSESEYMANDKQADRKKVQLVFDSEKRLGVSGYSDSGQLSRQLCIQIASNRQKHKIATISHHQRPTNASGAFENKVSKTGCKMQSAEGHLTKYNVPATQVNKWTWKYIFHWRLVKSQNV